MFRAALRLAPEPSRRAVHLITTAAQSQAVVERILSGRHKSVAVDCEGPQAGRFGQLAMVQLATDAEVFLFDTFQGGERLVEPLAPLLETRELVKVFHDCREDASLLWSRHKVSLAAIFDTQVAHACWLERQGLEIYQASVAELLRTFLLGTYRAHRWDTLERKPPEALDWGRRPLGPQAIRYAVEGVAHLLPLQSVLCHELGDPAGDMVLRRSTCYTEYAHLNQAELPNNDVSRLRPGLPLQAMLVARKPHGAAYFKLNHAPITGAVLDEADLREFQDLQCGDVAPCRVKSVSECRQFVHLQREGHGNLVFERQHGRMRVLPSKAAVDLARPPRDSGLYGYGAKQGEEAAIETEPIDYRERKPEVIYKKGKRGGTKIRDFSIKPPRPRGARASE